MTTKAQIEASIYIPRFPRITLEKNFGLSNKCYVDFFSNIFSFAGNVLDVDIIPMNKSKKSGFTEDISSEYVSAFVHFTSIVKDVNSRAFNFWVTILENNKAYKYEFEGRYFLCLKNIHPVQRTQMNIHQVVENSRNLEEIVKRQSGTIVELRKELNKQGETIERMNCVLNQLIGGLFNQYTQRNTMQRHLDVLSDGKSGNSLNDVSVWEGYPTTRQGDECEKKLKKLEEIVYNMYYEKKEQQEETSLEEKKIA